MNDDGVKIVQTGDNEFITRYEIEELEKRMESSAEDINHNRIVSLPYKLAERLLKCAITNVVVTACDVEIDNQVLISVGAHRKDNILYIYEFCDTNKDKMINMKEKIRGK